MGTGTHGHTLQEMSAGLRSAAETLEAMLKDGVSLDVAVGGVGEDCAHLVTTDPEIARKYEMQPEEDFFGDAGEKDDVRRDDFHGSPE